MTSGCSILWALITLSMCWKCSGRGAVLYLQLYDNRNLLLLLLSHIFLQNVFNLVFIFREHRAPLPSSVNTGGLCEVIYTLITSVRIFFTITFYRTQWTAEGSVLALPVTFCLCVKDSQPFRSRANSLPGANRPIEPWPIPDPLAPWNLRSRALSLPGLLVSRLIE